jgi:GT2 family glycosyltransferase
MKVLKSFITVSIVLYENDALELRDAIDSCLNCSPIIRIILVDNSPTNFLSVLNTDLRIEYIHNPLNPGFGASHNIAIKRAYQINSTFHLVLNPDVYFTSDTIDKIVNFMDSNIEIGQLMPKVLFPNGELQYLCKRNPTFFDLFIRGFMPNLFKQFFRKRINKYDYRSYNLDEIIYDIPYLSGCFMFFRLDKLRIAGYFDENIFMYLEDADITRRILELSKTVYYPGAVVYHHYAGLTHKKIKFKLITIQSAIYYFNKWGWFKSLY